MDVNCIKLQRLRRKNGLKLAKKKVQKAFGRKHTGQIRQRATCTKMMRRVWRWEGKIQSLPFHLSCMVGLVLWQGHVWLPKCFARLYF